jgi:hypothetical protein
MRIRGLVLAIAAVSSVLIGMTAVSNAAESRSPSLSFFFSPPDPQQNTHVAVKVCVGHAARGWLVRLQEAEGRGHVWRTVLQYRSPLANDCVWTEMSSGSRGLKPFRAQLVARSMIKQQTPVKDLRVYGLVAGTVFFNQPHSPYLNTYWKAVAANGHVYGSLGRIDAGDSSFSSGQNTCKWLVVKLLSTDNHAGDPKSYGVSTFGIDQYSLDPQSVTFPDNQLTTWGMRLDGSIFELLYSNTDKYSSGYVLTVGTKADCYTATGF